MPYTSINTGHIARKRLFEEMTKCLITISNYAKKVDCSADWIRKLDRKNELIDFGIKKGFPNRGIVDIDGVKFVKID